MTFHEVLFPPKVSFGALGGPRFKTTIGVLDSGHEQRNQEWAKVRYEYDVAHLVKKQDDEYVPVRDFHLGRRGMLFAFRYWDPTDHFLARHAIGESDESGTYQIRRAYSDAINPYVRDLFKIDDGSLANPLVTAVPPKLWVDNVLDAGATFDLNLGTVSPSAEYYGDTLEVECFFHVPVRFDIDWMPASLEHFKILNISSIPLVEVRDIT